MKGNKAGSTLVEKKKGSSTSSYASISSSPQAKKRHAPSPNRNSPAAKEKFTVGSPPPKKRKLDKLHVVQRLGSKSLKRYQRYYKLKPKHDITVLPEIASHFDGLHVDEKEVITRFLQTLKQLNREKRRVSRQSLEVKVEQRKCSSKHEGRC
ncbi:uncharacterized protein ACA1_366520 [Acanthamoeba castellanii str. Neff]|uniref:Histone deacetylase complex subunit SAP30 Sin3 binding domain-containing protein n=1 Tax=Acanthamoeba castellanii (strain ATCC 30010 / Neff) TaxID=1257118 RepID=L8GLU3_ACACF|nr:uncharacterized protein ACA1_366520 [Acanthamoeba castellanii str. Neff]ELR14040.1 hypothetical protein ACA1_366520 [Acanthamoeba castellanii str. Neff]